MAMARLLAQITANPLSVVSYLMCYITSWEVPCLYQGHPTAPNWSLFETDTQRGEALLLETNLCVEFTLESIIWKVT